MTDQPVKMVYLARLVKVVDGDTVDMEFILGFDIKTVKRVRLAGVQTPEINNTPHGSVENSQGMVETFFVANWFNDRPEWLLVTVHGQGFFGRWVCTIQEDNEKKSLNEELVERGWGAETFYKNGRPFWNTVAEGIEVNYPLGRHPFIAFEGTVLKRK